MAAQFNSNATTTHVVMVAGTVIYEYTAGWNVITGSSGITHNSSKYFEWVNANGTLVALNGLSTDAWKWSGTGNASALDDDGRFSKGTHIAWFDNRLWIGNVNGATNQVWYSDTAAIETWGATSFFNFGGTVNGLVPSQNALVVHTDVGIVTLVSTGNATTPYRANIQTRKAGIAGRSIIALPDDTQLMVLDDGVYRWSGGSELEKISYQLDEGYWPNLNSARLSESFALRFPREDEVWFALPHGSSQTNMNNIMVYSRRFDRWHGPYDGWERNCMALIDSTPHAGDFGGILWDHDYTTTYDDAGAPINLVAETGAPAPFGDVKVRWLNARFYYDSKGPYNLGVTQSIIGESSSVQQLDLGGNTLVLPGNIPAYISDNDQFEQDIDLIGYAPQTSLKMAMNATNQTFVVRKIFPRFKPLGRFTKAKIKDE